MKRKLALFNCLSWTLFDMFTFFFGGGGGGGGEEVKLVAKAEE